jgi:hypothetical protein
VPTVRNRTVGSGGDYSTLVAWESGEQANLITLDEIRQAQLIDGYQETNKVLINGWTTDATRYWRVYTTVHHNGVWSTSRSRQSTTSKDSFKVTDTAVWGRIEGWQAELTGGTDIVDFWKFDNTSGSIIVRECLFRKTGGSGQATKALTAMNDKKNGSANRFVNCLFWDWRDTTGTGGIALDCAASTVYNCGAYDCDKGYDAAGLSLVKNTWAMACGDGFVGTFLAGTTNNASDITSDAPGSNPSTGNAVFVNAAGDDYHLDSSDTVCKDKGVDLSGDATFAFSIDIDLATRSGTWDIGPDEITAAPPATLLQDVIYRGLVPFDR